ncbi:MAG: hypothetical protein ACUZ8A_01470, partial [Candidatus Bathyanammoxibius sp.]
DYDGDRRAFLLAETPDFTEILSVTEATLNNGTDVTVWEWDKAGTYPGWRLYMFVEINGVEVTFGIDASPTIPVPGGLEMALEILLSLDF